MSTTSPTNYNALVDSLKLILPFGITITLIFRLWLQHIRFFYYYNLSDQQEWKPKILQLMEEQKIYLEPQLSLKDMANQLRSNPSVISAAINQNFDKNFNDFVNEYRVKEFQTRQLLPENKNFTLLAIALDCSFNSKSTFNRSFKKITGKAPREVENV